MTTPTSRLPIPNWLLLWGPVIVYMAAILLLSAQSSPPAPASVSDKVLHAIEYGVLALLVFRAVSGGLPVVVDARRAGLTMLITVAYAASDELHQLFVPQRNSDLRDFLADAAGAAIAVIACWAWHIIRNPGSRITSPKSQR